MKPKIFDQKEDVIKIWFEKLFFHITYALYNKLRLNLVNKVRFKRKLTLFTQYYDCSLISLAHKIRRRPYRQNSASFKHLLATLVGLM